MSLLSPDLCIGKINEVFHWCGNNSEESELLNKGKRGRAKEARQRLRKIGGMPLGPDLMLPSSLRNAETNSSLSIYKKIKRLDGSTNSISGKTSSHKTDLK